MFEGFIEDIAGALGMAESAFEIGFHAPNKSGFHAGVTGFLNQASCEGFVGFFDGESVCIRRYAS